MTKRKVRVGRCYRCIYEWRMRDRNPRVCPRCKSRLWRVPKIRPVVLGNALGIDEVLGPYRHEILRAGRKWGAARLWVFGSVCRKEATNDSDVDILVSWRKRHSLLDRTGLRLEIEDIIGRRVDLVNYGALAWPMAAQVEFEKVPL